MYPPRRNAPAVRLEIENRLSKRAPAALTPQVRHERERTASGAWAVDDCLYGGLPEGAITELVGAECSGRTTIAQTYAAAAIQNGNVVAWIDADDTFDPESATIGGIDCERLLWVRCGRSWQSEQAELLATSTRFQDVPKSQTSQPSPSGGGSPHPRSEGRGMPKAIEDLLAAQPRSGALPLRRRDKSIGTPGVPNRPLLSLSADREEQVATDRLPPRRGEQVISAVAPPRFSGPLPFTRRDLQPGFASMKQAVPLAASRKKEIQPRKSSWSQLDQALRATDLLLQSGGFNLIVLDLGSTPAEMSWRIPLASWFRYRAACERTRASLLLLTKHPCAKSSAELVMRMDVGAMEAQGRVLTSITFRAELERQRFQKPVSNVVPIRKPPQNERTGRWAAQTAWAL